MGLWGKTKNTDRIVLQVFNKSYNTWMYIEDIELNGAGKKCRTMAKKTGVPHRVWNATTNTLFCEST